jgi:aromatic ring-opening dioxygenase catalytic subunit (LigB family)
MQPVLFLSHGGGPMPLLSDPAHAELNATFGEIGQQLNKPKAIIVISAHWEEPEFTVSTASKPGMIYDYGGFPAEAYEFQYPAAGDAKLANAVITAFSEAGLAVSENSKRGFDHGVFVPLLLLYPKADIPVVTVSLKKNFDPIDHIRLGQGLQRFREQGCLIIGSGMQYHNLPLMFNANQPVAKKSAKEFTGWLDETLTNDALSEEDRANELAQWAQAPSARLAHPREEHLLPLHVCYGAAGHKVTELYQYDFLGLPGRCYRWG